MDFNSREENGCLIVEVLASELNFEVGEEFKRGILSMFADSQCRKLILNLGNVSFIDSKAIGAMVSLRKSLIREGGQLVLTDLQLYVQKIISVVTLNTIFEVYGKEKEAVAAG